MHTIRHTLFAVFLLALFPLQASATGFEAGKHYTELAAAESAAPREGPIPVEVFVWYGCGGCYKVEPQLYALQESLPEDVEMTFYPALFGGIWNMHGRLMLTFQEMGVDHSVHQAAFEAIQSRSNRLMKGDEIHEFLQQHGIDEQRFADIYNSEAISKKAALVTLKAERYGLRAVPAVVVDGRYVYTIDTAGSVDNFVELVGFLSDRARAER